MKATAPKIVELRYARALRNVARYSSNLVMLYVQGHTIPNAPGLARAVTEYVAALTPWANSRAFEMLKAVDSANRRYWQAQARAQSRAVRLELAETPIAETVRRLLGEQVQLITSLPVKAAERAQTLAREAVVDGTRNAQIAEEIAKTPGVTESRALLIARTETAKANSVITQTRAVSVGSAGYIWRTVHDEAVRESHAEMDGQYVRWDSPPTLSDGTTTHAGQIYNCRCFAEPALPARDY